MTTASYRIGLLCWSLSSAVGQSLAPLDAGFDVIVVGTGASVTLALPDTTVQITVEQTLKGPVAVGQVLHAKGPYPYTQDVGARQPKGTYRGIWLLKTDVSGWYRYSPADSNTPVSRAYLRVASVPPAAAALQASIGESTQDAITRLVAGSLEEGGGNVEEFLGVAGTSNSATVSGILHYFANSADSTKRVAGLRGLIMRNDKQALMDFLNGRATFSAHDISRMTVAMQSVLSTDPDVIRALGSVFSDASCPASLKEVAAWALSGVHTREALPYLAAMLDSSDPARQMDGVFGLSGFANGFQMVSPGNMASLAWISSSKDTAYTTDATKQHAFLRSADARSRAEIITFWRNWWQDNSIKLAAN